ncbi:MAG TPA: carbamoyltransferase C-terminal domain-containing protein [Candidatus Acidoferrales bacterium]|nr:carbamoyltransferase C-terminal domain-containing protein [Candidatus Acidoferrales bacterium]
MKILGISGLEKAVPFKRSHWPALDPREYRISQGHDSAAALLVDGKLIAAAEEERFSGKKHTGDFPIGAIRYCLEKGGISIHEIDEIAHGFDYAPYRQIYSLDSASAGLYEEVFSREALLAQARRELPDFPAERIHQVPHHLAHAASAAYTSGWEECLVVVNDAMGEVQSLTAYRFSSGQLEKLREIPANDSIGILYSLVTLHLGFDFNSDEYKIMGLAPYGDPARYRGFFEQAVELREDGTIRIPILRLNKTRDARETYAATRAYLDEHLIARRDPRAEVTADHQDVAAALQECLDRTVLHVCGHFGRQTGLRRIAMAGGVALNCTANGRLVASGLFDEVYIQPVAGDDGTALGAALHRASLSQKMCNRRMAAPLLGPAYCEARIQQALESSAGRIQHRRFDSRDATCAEAARLIAEGRVIAWYRGRMEFGPRALGNRSILADPGHPEMRDRINAMVKKREAFRPFAPACSREQAHIWFEVAPGSDLPYMITIVDVRPEHRAALPAITHVNGSARLQTVSSADNCDFHALLRAVGKTTGREMVLNTSFNVKGQPIVNTPEEAIETFLGTGIEYLFLENHLVSR